MTINKLPFKLVLILMTFLNYTKSDNKGYDFDLGGFFNEDEDEDNDNDSVDVSPPKELKANTNHTPTHSSEGLADLLNQIKKMQEKYEIKCSECLKELTESLTDIKIDVKSKNKKYKPPGELKDLKKAISDANVVNFSQKAEGTMKSLYKSLTSKKDTEKTIEAWFSRNKEKGFTIKLYHFLLHQKKFNDCMKKADNIRISVNKQIADMSKIQSNSNKELKSLTVKSSAISPLKSMLASLKTKVETQ